MKETNKGKALLVEDEEKVRKFMASLLHSFGYDVAACEDGRHGYYAAVESISKKTPYACIITDVIMPEMSGPQMILSLREYNGSVDPYPVVFVSANIPEEDQKRLASLQTPYPVLNKPFSMSQLEQAIAEALKVHESAFPKQAVQALDYSI